MPGSALPEAERLRLLAAYEPVLAFTEGEMFTPVAAERFIEVSALWCTRADGEPEELMPAGQLTVARLVEEAQRSPEARLQLRFVDRPLRGRDYARWHARPDRPRMQRRGRFTKVGVLARFIDALFRVGLLLRGRIPGGFSAAADERARQVFAGQPPVYHGRVVEDGGYVVLQYWFFYVMNDWRSTFGGVNDHEGDWELVTVYLACHGDELRPRWVGMSSHDDEGDDLRRRWDDPDLRLVGTHPVVHVGAGSHAGAVLPGDYVVAVDPPVVQPLLAAVRRFTTRVGRSGVPGVGLRVPYVDYKRGDGRRVGPGQDVQWQREVIDDETAWVTHFQGLWGLDTAGRFGGERAPAGPRFDRSGAVRRSWADPLGWVGLHKVPPSADTARQLLEERVASLDAELEELDAAIPAARDRLRRQWLLERASGGVPPAPPRAGEMERSVAHQVEQRAALHEERRLALVALARGGPEDPPHAHLRQPPRPWATEHSERDRFLKVWATVSSPLLVAAMVVIILLRPPGRLLTALGALLLGFFAVEAVARGRALSFLRTVVKLGGGAVAVVLAAVVALAYWRISMSVLLGLAALWLLVLNVSDLRRR